MVWRPTFGPVVSTPALPWEQGSPIAGGGGAVPWTPLTPGTPAWWLRGDSVTLNGATVASWLDKSGNGRHWTQGSAPLQPTYVASAINGQPGLTFSAAATQELVGPDLNAVGLTGAETFIVVQLNADPPASAPFCGFWRTGSAASVAVVPFTDGTIYDEFGTTVRKTTVNPTKSLATPSIYSVISTSSEWTNSLDGTQQFTTATNTVGWNTATRIGSSVTNFFDGVMCEWIVYGAKLSAANRAAAIAYLKARYGIA